MRRHRDEAAQERSPGKNQRRRIASDEDENEAEGMDLDSDDDEEEEEQEQENQGYGRGYRARRAFNPFGSQIKSGFQSFCSSTSALLSASPTVPGW
jgi:hypothetical protein